MTIIIRDKHTGEEKDFSELSELYRDGKDIIVIIQSQDGWKRLYSFNNKDYEIAYIF